MEGIKGRLLIMIEYDEKVLFVDDEENVLIGLQRQLRKSFRIETATSGYEGLQLLKNSSQYAIVVSDMRMPGMNGVEFLSKVKDISPDTVRMMLTGNSDQATTKVAVNKGNIFRFLTKPCSPSELSQALLLGMKQYHITIAEKELLEKTLKGSIVVLTEILSLMNPIAFGRASRIKKYMVQLVNFLQLENLWQYEMSAMLSQVGCLLVPSEIIKKVNSGIELTQAEKQVFEGHPAVGRRLLEKIPRLEDIAKIVGYQNNPGQIYHSGNEKDHSKIVQIGAKLLKIIIDFDIRLNSGMEVQAVMEEFQQNPMKYEPTYVNALSQIKINQNANTVKNVLVKHLTTGMTIHNDIKSKNGSLLITKGQDVTVSMLEFLKGYIRGVGVKEPIKVTLKD